MIKIRVEVFAFLKDYVPAEFKQGKDFVFLESPMSVDNLLKKIRIPDHIDKIVLVNDKYVSPIDILKEGDVVKVFPPVPGG